MGKNGRSVTELALGNGDTVNGLVNGDGCQSAWRRAQGLSLASGDQPREVSWR